MLLLLLVSALVVVVTLMNFPELFDIYPAVNSACGTQPTSIECGQNLNKFICVNQVLLLQLFLHLNLMECLIRGFAQWCWDLLTAWIKITWATETILIFIEPELLFEGIWKFTCCEKCFQSLIRWRKEFRTTNMHIENHVHRISV